MAMSLPFAGLRPAAVGAIGTHAGVPVVIVAMLAMMTLPVPPLVLDVMFTFNIALALVVLLVAVYALRPLEFALFPTVLLVATMLRLALNVASTRVVLLHGHDGGAAAGHVIEAFGNVVVGGNYVVGLVVFAILVIINFVVVTKGAGRVSEVSARFTLDAMPGKQMAIDADLNAGVIDQDTARRRREEIGREADFYGAMDGASKFVRGDAIAGILVVLINIVGGLGIGMGQHGLAFDVALRNYALLTIGDGLVAQIPALLMSLAAAIMVTRVSAAEDMGQQVVGQMFSDPRALTVTAVVLGVAGSIPGMPHVAFLGLAGVVGGLAWWRRQRTGAAEATPPGAAAAGAAVTPAPAGTAAGGGAAGGAGGTAARAGAGDGEFGWDDVQPVDAIGLEVGYRLIPLVDRSQGGELLPRIKGVRKKLSGELGFLVPTVHVRDNLDLGQNAYRITLMGVTVAEADVHADRMLAIDPGKVFGKLEGIAGHDPAFGLDAVWVEPGQRERAESLGYTVVDAATVVATHLNHLMGRHAAELLGHDEAQKLLDRLRATAPRLAEELIPNTVPLGTWLRVLRNLLAEQVPIRDLRTIAEAIIEASARGKEPERLTAAVRLALGRLIVQTVFGGQGTLAVMTLDGELESLIARASAGGQKEAALEPTLVDRLRRALLAAAERQEALGRPPVLVVHDGIRALLSRLCRFPQRVVHVLAFGELPDDRQVDIVATVGGPA
jgi:flagellar biosynthesis protein FlhA